MERFPLKANARQEKGKGAARRVRREGFIPGIIYGAGHEPLTLTLDPKELHKVFNEAGGTNVLFDLQIDGKEKIPVMVRDYQVDIIDRNLLHVDLLKVDLTKKIKVDVPIRLMGKAPGVKEGGILEHMCRALEVSCLPTAIPEFIEADVSHLDIGDTVHLHDLKIPEGVEVITTTDLTIAAVVLPVEEKVEEVAPEVAVEGAEAAAPAEGEKKPGEEAAPAKGAPGKAPAKAEGKEEKKEGKGEKKEK